MSSWSMSRRLVVRLTLIIGALWAAGVTFAAFSIRHEIDEVFDSALQETAQRILPLAADDLEERTETPEKSERLSAKVGDDDHEEYLHYQVRNRAGRVLLRSHDAEVAPFPAPITRGFHDDGERRYFTEVSADGNIVVQVAELPEERREAVGALWLGLLVPLLGVLPLVALAIRGTVKSTTRPVHEVQRELRARNGVNLAAIDAHGLPSELTPMVEDMNRMLERLSAALEAERAFAANSAHELRNPIAAARAQAEIVAQTSTTDPERNRAAQLVGTLAELGRKIETMLQLARAEAGLGLSREETSLSAVVQLLVDDYSRKPQAQKRVRFEDAAGAPVKVRVDPDALGIAIQNLIDNALKHASPGSEIDIKLGPGPVLSVRNEAPIVAPADLAKLTSRFERGNVSGQDGVGLGLYIADTIMRQSGGRLELHSPPPGYTSGFEAVLRFSMAI